MSPLCLNPLLTNYHEEGKEGRRKGEGKRAVKQGDQAEEEKKERKSGSRQEQDKWKRCFSSFQEEMFDLLSESRK